MRNKRGQLDVFKGVAMALVTIGILFGVGLLVLGEFKGSAACETGYTFNASRDSCMLDTDSGNTSADAGLTDAGNGTSNFISSLSNISDKAPTAGILFGVALIIVGAAVALTFLNNRQSGF